MSADNFWYVKGNEVYMGFASDWTEEGEADLKAEILSGEPQYVGTDHEDALHWAFREYAEYGVWWVEDEAAEQEGEAA